MKNIAKQGAKIVVKAGSKKAPAMVRPVVAGVTKRELSGVAPNMLQNPNIVQALRVNEDKFLPKKGQEFLKDNASVRLPNHPITSRDVERIIESELAKPDVEVGKNIVGEALEHQKENGRSLLMFPNMLKKPAETVVEVAAEGGVKKKLAEEISNAELLAEREALRAKIKMLEEEKAAGFAQKTEEAGSKAKESKAGEQENAESKAGQQAESTENSSAVEKGIKTAKVVVVGLGTDYVNENVVKPIKKSGLKVAQAVVLGGIAGAALAMKQGRKHVEEYKEVIADYYKILPKNDIDPKALEREREVLSESLNYDQDEAFRMSFTEYKRNSKQVIAENYVKISDEEEITRALKASLVVESDKFLEARNFELHLSKTSSRIEARLNEVVAKVKKGLDATNPEMTKSEGRLGQAIDQAILAEGGKKASNAYHVVLDIIQGKHGPDVAHDVTSYISRAAVESSVEFSGYARARSGSKEVIDFAKTDTERFKDIPSGVKEVQDLIADKTERLRIQHEIQIELYKESKNEELKALGVEPKFIVDADKVRRASEDIRDKPDLEENFQRRRAALTPSQAEILDRILATKEKQIDTKDRTDIYLEKKAIDLQCEPLLKAQALAKEVVKPALDKISPSKSPSKAGESVSPSKTPDARDIPAGGMVK